MIGLLRVPDGRASPASDGLDVLTVVSFIVLAMFAFGIVGALREPPDE